MKSMLSQSFKVIVEYLGKEKEFVEEIRKAENKGFETYAEAKAHAEAVVNKYNKAVPVAFAVVVNSYDWLGSYTGTHFCEKVEAGNEPAEAPTEKKSIFLTKSVANDVPMAYNNKCSEGNNPEQNQTETNQRKKELKMAKYIEFAKGGNTGTIMATNEGTFIAVTPTASKTYKTERGARNFMAKFGYEEVPAVDEVPAVNDENVLDLTFVNLKDTTELETLVSNFASMPEHIKTFILNECTSFFFVGDSILLYQGRKAVAEAHYYTINSKAEIQSIGAGELFQWNKYQQETEPAEVVAEAPAEEKNEKKSIFLTKSVANDVPIVYNNKCSEEHKPKTNQRKKEFKMKKTVFTFTVKGQKQTFNTMKELVEAKRQLNANGQNVDLYSIKKEEVKVKASASLEFDSYTFEESDRTLTAYVNVKSEEAEAVFNALASIMEAELGESFMGCPVEENGYYSDGITVEYVHGSMTSIKEDIKHVFKMAKASLGIR